MATMQRVTDLVTAFSKLYARRSAPDPDLIDAWYTALEPYGDDRLDVAGKQLMREMSRMPVPADLIQRLPKVERNETIIFGKATCRQCGEYKNTMTEPGQLPVCRPCYTGLPDEVIGQYMRTIRRKLDKMCALNPYNDREV